MDKSNSEKRKIAKMAVIVQIVMAASNKVYPKWKERISEMEASSSKETRTEIAEAFTRAVAEEIIKNHKVEIHK